MNGQIESVKCDCGGKYTQKSFERHQKSTRHRNYFGYEEEGQFHPAQSPFATIEKQIEIKDDEKRRRLKISYKENGKLKTISRTYHVRENEDFENYLDDYHDVYRQMEMEQDQIREKLKEQAEIKMAEQLKCLQQHRH